SPPQLQSQPLQGSALAALASNSTLQSIGPHQAHYIMMMHQQQQQQHLNGTVASASPMIQHAHPAVPATASALKIPQQQQQQLRQQQQQQQYAQSKSQKKPQFPPTPAQKSSLPPPLSQGSTVPTITDTPPSSASGPAPAQSAEPSPLVPPLPATAPTQAPAPVPDSQEAAGSASPAPSTETRKSRSSPRPPRRSAKESKRKHPAARRDGVAVTAAKAGGAPTKQAQTALSPPQLPQKPADSEPAAAVMEPTAMPRARSFQKTLPRWPQGDAVLGAGTERLLAFHSALGPSGEPRDLDHWTSAISSSFAQGGTIRMEIGGQSYDMPAATAGRFYHRLFGDGGVVSIHVALSSAQVHMLGNAASIVSFHGVLLTTAYANGRRVLEAGDLRVIFDPRFRIRVWAFSCADATVCLPRKRPNGADDALARSSDATIARNLDWPDMSPAPAPKRRKSAHGRQPPDECAIPACALQHLEIANTMGLLRDLISTQAMHPAAPSADVLALWRLSRARDPAMLLALAPSPATPSTAVANAAAAAVAATASVERKRARRRSVANAAAAATAAKDAKSADASAPKEAPTTPVRKQRAAPAHQTKPGPGARK
ncbi:hypothetical protein H4S06_002657, partial [Coemansia sp. BCRC 34490]